MRLGARRFVLATILLVALAACSPARFDEAASVLADIDAGTGPSALKAATAAPERRPVAYDVGGRKRVADAYVPADGARAGLVVVPGLARAGKDDPRLVAFAETLARAGFEVLVPDLAGLRQLRVEAADSRAIADAVLYLDSRGGDRGVGLIAISFAAGPALAALFEPGVGARVDIVVTVGGYHDLDAVIGYATTGHYRAGAGEPWLRRTPNPLAKWVIVASNAPRLDDPGDRAVLTAIAERKLADPGADVADLAAALGAEGRAVYALVVNADPDRVPTLIAALPERVRSEIAALDLDRRDLGTLSSRFVLVHGRDDPLIAETESVALAAALPRERTDLYLLDSLDHVDPKPLGLGDKLRLIDAIYTVLSIRDGS